MNKVNRLTASFAVIIMILFSLSSCFPFYYYEEPVELELLDDVSMKYVYDQEYECYEVYLDGVAENTSDKDLSGCSVSFTLYDKDGNVIGMADAYIYELKQDAKWRFSAYGSVGYEPVSFELDELCGYDYDY